MKFAGDNDTIDYPNDAPQDNFPREDMNNLLESISDLSSSSDSEEEVSHHRAHNREDAIQMYRDHTKQNKL